MTSRAPAEPTRFQLDRPGYVPGIGRRDHIVEIDRTAAQRVWSRLRNCSPLSPFTQAWASPCGPDRHLSRLARWRQSGRNPWPRPDQIMLALHQAQFFVRLCGTRMQRRRQ